MHIWKIIFIWNTNNQNEFYEIAYKLANYLEFRQIDKKN